MALSLPENSCILFRGRRCFSSPCTKNSNKNEDTSYRLSFSKILAWYSRKLDTHPFMTKSLSSGLIAGAGDVACQLITAETKWDFARTSRFGILGLFLIGPVVHTWYGFMAAKQFPVWTRVFLDQVIFTPQILSAFLMGLWTLEGSHQNQKLHQLQLQLPSTVVANWALWVPAQAINFRFVPTKYQVLFSNVTALVWNCYLSYTQASRTKHHQQ